LIRLATVCARKNSKGLIGKNKLLINGLPLFAWAIIQAKKSNYFHTIVVTTDDDEIIEMSYKYGADLTVKRPLELSTDTSGKPETILHALKEVEKVLGLQFDVVVDLDVTSPLRSIEDIKGAVNLLEQNKVSSVLSVCHSRRNPYFNILEVDKAKSIKVSKSNGAAYLSRQSAPECFDMNAAVHVWRARSLKKNPKIIFKDTLLYVMPSERSWDIDSQFDFEVVKFLSERNN